MNDEVLIHVKGWREMLRYATHERGDDWQPPLVSLETARMRGLVWDLTPLEFAVYHALIGMYAGAAVLNPLGRVKGNEGVPRRLTLRRALQELTSARWVRSGRIPGAIDSLIHADLVVLATVDGRLVDRSVLDLSREGRGRERGHGRGHEPIAGQDLNDPEPEFLDPAETVRA